MTLEVLSAQLTICRLGSDADVPGWAMQGKIWSITRTRDELSIVCEKSNVPTNMTCNTDWRTMKVQGPLDFSLVGIMASLTTPLAEAGVSIFAMSTYDTDYLLVKEADLSKSIDTLKAAGHEVIA